MLKLLALGIGFGLVYGAWNQSRLPNGSIAPLVVLAVIGMVAAYLGGRARRGSAYASATAVAVADATAVANSQQAVVLNVNMGAREVAATRYGGLDRVDWYDPDPLLALDAEIVEQDGIDVARDVMERRTRGEQQA